MIFIYPFGQFSPSKRRGSRKDCRALPGVAGGLGAAPPRGVVESVGVRYGRIRQIESTARLNLKYVVVVVLILGTSLHISSRFVSAMRASIYNETGLRPVQPAR